MAATKNNIPAEVLELYDRLIATIPGVDRKGAAMPYTSVNGHMFSFIEKDGTLVLRLPAEQREKFIKQYKTGLHEAHGTVLKEYVDVPAAMLKKTEVLAGYFKESYEYVSALKPKKAKA